MALVDRSMLGHGVRIPAITMMCGNALLLRRMQQMIFRERHPYPALCDHRGRLTQPLGATAMAEDAAEGRSEHAHRWGRAIRF